MKGTVKGQEQDRKATRKGQERDMIGLAINDQ